MPAKPIFSRRGAWSGACLFAAAALLTAVVSGQPRDIAGSYVLDEALAERNEAARVAAIEVAARSLPEEARFGLQARLDVLTRPAPRIEVQRSGDDVVLRAGESVELRSAADGASEDIKGGLELAQRIEGGALVQTIEGDNLRGKASATQLVQTLRYVPGARGEMTLQTTITGGDLAVPLILTASYLRL